MITLVLAAALLAPARAVGHPDLVKRGCMVSEVYEGPERIPELWQEIGSALRRTGITRRMVAACYRGTGVWTGWVKTAPKTDEPALWVVVMWDGPATKVLCVTSEDDGCRKYWNPPPR